MLEIFALPYFAVSGVIGWAIFEPFFRADEHESPSLASLSISDLLAVALPVSILFASTSWMLPSSILSPSVQAIVVVVALLFALGALATGLFLVPKTYQVSFLKRMAVVGVIAPCGMFVTIGWIGFLVWACAHSIAYFVPSSVAIAIATIGLRVLGVWVCRTETAQRRLQA